MRTLLSVLACAVLFPLAVYCAEPLKVCMLSASQEYKSDESLAAFKTYLEEKYAVKCTILKGMEKGTGVEGIAALNDSDVMVCFTRRVTLPDDQLAVLKKFLESGKGIVGIRTASHGFQNYLQFDKEVLGGSYNNHYGDENCQYTIDEKAKDHAVLAGVKGWAGPNKLYKNPTLAPDATLLLTGTSDKHKEPVAWLRVPPAVKGRVFYTSQGVPEDFANEHFRTLLVNAIFWSAGKTPAAK
jgi:type 1 glutamine amidotransferase